MIHHHHHYQPLILLNSSQHKQQHLAARRTMGASASTSLLHVCCCWRQQRHASGAATRYLHHQQQQHPEAQQQQQPQQQQQQKQKQQQQAATSRSDGLDPADFSFVGLVGGTHTKPPGSVAGQQFTIDGCQDSTLVVLDRCACVTIDDCANCRLLLGPTDGSVFLRNCRGCSVATLSRQLRARDCADCELALLVRTGPVIEACSGMAFSCFASPYAGLALQMAAAGMSPLQNRWWDVFDFTPTTAAAEAPHTPRNWRLQAPTEGGSLAHQLCVRAPSPCPQPAAAEGDADLSDVDVSAALAAADEEGGGAATPPASPTPPPAPLVAADRQCVVCTWGPVATSTAATLLLLFPCSSGGEGGQAAAQAWLQTHVAGHLAMPPHEQQQQPEQLQGVLLRHTNEAVLSQAVLQQMGKAAGWSRRQLRILTASGSRGRQQSGLRAVRVVGLELACSEEDAVQRLAAAGTAAGALWTRSAAAAELFRSIV